MIEGQEGVSWEQWMALAEATERSGLEGLFRSDHYLSGDGRVGLGSSDAWTTLAAIAARTQRIRLGTMVSPATFRHPSVVASAANVVDHVSGGRVELGLGAGWYELEHETYGFPFRTARERVDELARQLAEITRQWTEADDVCPAPLQRPRPPIVVGGRAKPRTVALAVRFADEYNTVSPTVDEARERRRAVDDAARAAGREPLRFSMMAGCVVGRDAGDVAERLGHIAAITGRQAEPPPIAGTLDEVVATLQEYEAAGVERAMLQHLYHEDVEMVGLLGEVASALRA